MEKFILLTGTLLLSAPLSAAEYRIQHCQACSPAESQQLALQHFKPEVSCSFPTGNHNPEQTGLCVSTPVDAYIYSENNQQLLSFRISHQRQNVDRATLLASLSATAQAAPDDIRQMAKDGVYIWNELQQADQRAVQSFIQAINGTTNPFTTDGAEPLAHSKPLSPSECANSDAAKALRHALTPSTTAAIQDHIEQLAALDRAKGDALAEERAELTLDGPTGTTLSVPFQSSLASYKLSIMYDRGSVRAVEGVASPSTGSPRTANRVVFDVTAQGGGLYGVSVDRNQSQIEGQSLGDVLSDKNTGATLSQCAFDTLKQIVIPDIAVKDQITTGTTDGIARGSGAPRAGLAPFTGDGGGRCEYTFRLSSGTFSFIAGCP